MVGPDYQRPAVTTPDSFRGASAAIPPDKQSIGELKWFEVFQDEQLQELIRTALQQNYDLRDAVARVDAARANLGITQADQYPNFGIGADVPSRELSRQGEFTIPRGTSRQRTYGEVFLNLFSFEIDIWGRLAPGDGSIARRFVARGLDAKSGGHDPDQRRGHRLFQPSRTGCGIGDCKEHFSHAFRIASFDQASTARRGEHAFRRATGRATSL